MNVVNSFVFAEEEKCVYGEEKHMHQYEEKQEWYGKAGFAERVKGHLHSMEHSMDSNNSRGLRLEDRRLRTMPGQNTAHRNTVTLNIACLGGTGHPATATIQRGARLDSISIALRKAFTRKALLHEEARGRGERISTVSL